MRLLKLVKLRKQGNSLILTIPLELIEDLKWKVNDQILLETVPLEKHFLMSVGPKMLKAGKVV